MYYNETFANGNRYIEGNGQTMVKKIGIAGLLSNEDSIQEFIKVENMLSAKEGVKVYSLREMYYLMMNNADEAENTLDYLFDISSSRLDGVDAVVVVLPCEISEGRYRGMSAIGFIAGICWERGIPVIVYSPDSIDDNKVETNYLVQRAIQAYIHSFKELEEYDWKEMPYRKFKGNFKLDVAFNKKVLTDFASKMDKEV